jgi:hypothetical protein
MSFISFSTTNQDQTTYQAFADGEEALNNLDVKTLEQLLNQYGDPLRYLELRHVQSFLSSRAGKGENDLPMVKWFFEKLGEKIKPSCFEGCLKNAIKQGLTQKPLIVFLLENIGEQISSSTWNEILDRVNTLNPSDAKEMLECLLEHSKTHIQGVERAFENAAKRGCDGIPLMELFLNQVPEKVGFLTIRDVFKNAIWRKDCLTILKWLTEHASEELNYTSFKEAFDKASMAGKQILEDQAIPILKFLWEHIPQNDQFIYKEYFMNWILQRVLAKKGNDYTPQEKQDLLDWLLCKLVLLHGTSLFPLSEVCVDYHPLDPLLTHISKWGFSWEKTQLDSSQILQISFRPLFEEMNAQGLSFFEMACEQMPDQLSAFTFQWAFLKAAANGAFGQTLMQSLIEQRSGQLSYWCLRRACSIAKRNGHEETANWVQEQLKKFPEPQQLSFDDLKLLLASSTKPSGYRALGDLPKRYNWQPLTEEELERMIPQANLAPLEDDPFAGMSLKVVDDAKEQLAVDEISQTEQELFRKLYQRIEQGYTQFKIEGNEAFKNKMLGVVREFLMCPSGRWALLRACRLPYPLKIIETAGETAYLNKALCVNTEIHMYNMHKNPNGTRTRFLAALDSGIYHELIHALHDSVVTKEFMKLLNTMRSSDKNYDKLEELYTIAGCDEDCQDLELFALCENTYNFEKGYLERDGHDGDVSSNDPNKVRQYYQNTLSV